MRQKPPLGEFKVTTLKNSLINNQAFTSMRNLTLTRPISKYQPTIEPSLQYPIELDLVVDLFALHKSPICD